MNALPFVVPGSLEHCATWAASSALAISAEAGYLPSAESAYDVAVNFSDVFADLPDTMPAEFPDLYGNYIHSSKAPLRSMACAPSKINQEST